MEIGQDTASRFTSEAMEHIRDAIDEVGGREVFFAGALTPSGIVESVRVCARGHEGAVPAFMEGLDPREVVIHNHPSGEIAPSEADLQLASVFGFNGHGVYIVDNVVERVYVVVEPFIHTNKTPLDPTELDRYLSPAGKLAEAVPDFEVRPQQAEMMRAVAQAFNDNGVAVLEAPTGVGKTFAYLLPAVLWAIRNKERIVVSTRTINLQEQIVHKDIPLLARCLDLEFNTVLVKGRSNYLCQRKLRRVHSEATLFEDERDEACLQAILDWAEKTEDGSRSDLPFVAPKDVWERVCSEADTCRLSNCPDPKRCFIGKARRAVAKADILVVNHHMLFADLAIKKETGNFTSLAVLPAFKRLILDEAHSVEDSATEYFGMRVTRAGATTLIGRFVSSERGRERGLIPFLKTKLIREKGITRKQQEELLTHIDNDVLPHLAMTREGLWNAFDAIRALTADRCGQVGRDIKWRLREEHLAEDAWRDIRSVYVLPTAEDTINCAKSVNTLIRLLKKIEPPGSGQESAYVTEIGELEGYRDRLQRLATSFVAATTEELEPNTVRWVEIDGKNKHIVRVVSCPLHVGEPLAEWVYSNLDAMVMTSATLTVKQSFDFLSSRIGLDRIKGRSFEGVMLDSPFDFEKQALLCIPTDIVEPNDSGFLDETVNHIRRALTASKGHAFILFTSFYALDYAFRKLEPELRDAGIKPLKQGAAARTRLLDEFRADPSSVLFGTDSFWEGVDVAGDALQCVILPKLPFRVPTEPILEARAEAIDASGGKSFMEFTVPQAVIKFRQGFGRLIRRKTDSGVILVLDRRVVTKYYGRMFLESLPGVRVVKGPSEGVYTAYRKLFEAKRQAEVEDQ